MRLPLLGPLFWCELLRLARRGGQLRLRMAYVLCLLLGLFAAYSNTFTGYHNNGVSRDQVARFGEQFLITFLFTQLIAVILITPPLAGGAIVDEKDRHSLDFLLTSPLSSHEIVFGKFAARLVAVGSIVIAGWPILMLTLFFGGVDPELLLAGLCVAAATLFGLGTYSVMLGVLQSSLRAVLVRSYGLIVVLSLPGFCCIFVPGLATLSPLSTLWHLYYDTLSGRTSVWSIWEMTAAFSAVYAGIGCICLMIAVKKVREKSTWQERWLSRRESELEVDPKVIRWQRPTTRLKYSKYLAPRMKPGDDPHMWKERYFTGRVVEMERGFVLGCGMMIVVTFIVVMGLAAIFLAYWSIAAGRFDGMNRLVRVFVVCVGTILPVLMGLRTVGSIGRERQQQTLDSLLTLPTPRQDILLPRLIAPLHWAKVWIIVQSAVLLLAAICMIVNPIGGIITTGFFLAHIGFCLTYAVWLSIVCRSPMRATIIYMITLGVITILPLLIGSFMSESQIFHHVILRISPISKYWLGLDDLWSESATDHTAFMLIDFCIFILYLSAACVFWIWALYRFEQEGRN